MAADALEQSVLESKDREQLMAIASALGVKSTSRAKKADLIQKILETTGAIPAAGSHEAVAAPDPAPVTLFDSPPEASSRPAANEVVLGADGEPLADWEIELLNQGISTDTTPLPSTGNDRSAPTRTNTQARRTSAPVEAVGTTEGDGDGDADGDDDDAGSDGDAGAEGDGGEGDGGDGDGESRNRRRRRRRNKNRSEVGPDGERLDPGQRPGQPPANGGGNPPNGGGAGHNGGQNGQGQQNGQNRNDNGRDHNRNDRFDRAEADTSYNQDPVEVSGYLDLRDEGYGFLRVNGYLSSRDDSYIPVKLTRQFGLRKGDHVTGLSRPPARNEKNPALLEVLTVNGEDPDTARSRPRFEDLTPAFPNSKLSLEATGEPSPGNTTARIIDLVSPIGLGQRGLIVSPPKAGKTTIVKTIASAIERNHPAVRLIVLLVDERPEEITDMRHDIAGEVIATTFDRPSDEHTQIAEMCLEKAKRLVEQGDDVVVIVDGLTRLSRAHGSVGPTTGRILAGGIDAGALYAPKRFFGAARNVEEGGSLTILATALVGTGSPLDDAILQEFAGTANMELRLDRRLAERRIYPAIDVAGSSTRHEELLFTEPQLPAVWKLRRELADLAADGSAIPGLELLVGRIAASRTNEELLGATR